MQLYHYTCEHGMRGIGLDGATKPNAHPILRKHLPPVTWLTRS